MGKIVTDNLAYARVVQKMGLRTSASSTDLNDILPEEIVDEVKEAAEISMGTEIADTDLMNIQYLAEQVRDGYFECVCIECPTDLDPSSGYLHIRVSGAAL